MSKDLITSADPVAVYKQTTIQTFSPEEELAQLVKKGEWELILANETFQKRSPESQIQVFQQAIDERILLLRKSLYYLINRGPKQRAASMGVLQRIRKLEELRDDAINTFYAKGPRALAEKAGIKIDFY
jgi:hypothetical protein